MSQRRSSLDLSPVSGRAIGSRMTLAAVTFGVFTLFNTLRFLAYVPQIARALKDHSGAQAISLGTWSLFLVSHLSATAYAIVNQNDWTMATLFLLNGVGCGLIILIATVKRSQYRRRKSLRPTHRARTSRFGGAQLFAKDPPPADLNVAYGKSRRNLRVHRHPKRL